MKKKISLEWVCLEDIVLCNDILGTEDLTFNICWLKTGRESDFEPWFTNLKGVNRNYYDKVYNLILHAADKGPNINNITQYKKVFEKVFEMKASQIRVPFFYHPNISKLIVITNYFVKKQDEWPVNEIKRAKKLRKEAENLSPYGGNVNG